MYDLIEDISSIAQNLLVFTRFITMENTKKIPIKKNEIITFISFLYQRKTHSELVIQEIAGSSRSFVL